MNLTLEAQIQEMADDDAPFWCVKGFVDALAAGDLEYARSLLTRGLNQIIDRDRVDLLSEFKFLVEPGWGYSSRRRRNEDGTEIVKWIYNVDELQLTLSPTRRITYPFLMTKEDGEWRIASLGRETLLGPLTHPAAEFLVEDPNGAPDTTGFEMAVLDLFANGPFGQGGVLGTFADGEETGNWTD